MKSQKTPKKEPSSFRDPSGFVYYADGKVCRQINSCYRQEYLDFIGSGLCQKLIKQKLLIPFSEIKNSKNSIQLSCDKIPFISYPYEWSFSQLKDSALLTLKIQKIALDHNMSLKDASAYNIQFLDGQPIFIDLLSFEKYEEGKPWVAYQQFCQHFLGPLLLMAKVDINLNQLLRTHLEGIPLELASKLLPKSSFFDLATFSHIHVHARNQKKYANAASQKQELKLERGLSKTMLLGIVNSLKSTVKKIKLKNIKTEWGKYYTFTNYSKKAIESKKTIVKNLIILIKPKSVWDLGGNTGEFSRLASNQGIETISFDIDPQAVETNYLQVKNNKEKKILPLLLDLMNPSPNLGWSLSERKSLIERGSADLVMALALVHHLSISNNVPFELLAEFFAKLGKYLIIEFVPKDDSKVQTLLATRKDIFPNYNEKGFEESFSKFFTIKKKVPVKHGSLRTLYLMKVRV